MDRPVWFLAFGKPLLAVLALWLCAFTAHADDARWRYDPATDLVESTLVADGIRSTIRIEHRDGAPLLVWEYRGQKKIADFEAVNFAFRTFQRPARYPDAAVSHVGETSYVAIPLDLQQVTQLGRYNMFELPHYRRDEQVFIVLFYRLEGSDKVTSWWQELTNKGAPEAIAALLEAHRDDVATGRYPSFLPVVQRWSIEAMAAVEGAARPAAPPALDVFDLPWTYDAGEKQPPAVPLCAHFEQGQTDVALYWADHYVPGIGLFQLVHSLNCTRNKRDYAPGQHVFSLMINPKHIGLTHMEILSLIARFEQAGPEAGAYLSNLVHCPRLIMKRCGRGCYDYPEAVTLFDEIDRWKAAYPLDPEYQSYLYAIDAHLQIHQRRFPVIFDPTVCPAHLQKRVETVR